MKGLFVKDLKLMMLQKNFLLLILAIVIGMMIFTDDVIFPLGFLSFIVSLFTVSTISYDDFDNGNAFLFTLPITRNHYVSEKYFLGLLLGCMAWVLANCFRNNYNCIERYITYYRLSTEFIDDFTYYDCRSSNHASFSAKIRWR